MRVSVNFINDLYIWFGSVHSRYSRLSQAWIACVQPPLPSFLIFFEGRGGCTQARREERQNRTKLNSPFPIDSLNLIRFMWSTASETGVKCCLLRGNLFLCTWKELSCLEIRELQQRRRRRQRERQKNNRVIKQNNKLSRKSRFFCTFLSRLYKNTTWKCLISRFMEDVNKRRQIFLSLNFSAVPKKSTPRKFAHFWHFKRIGINAEKFEKTRIHF